MRHKPQQKIFLTGVIIALFATGLSPVMAADTNISHPYNSTLSMPAGSIVSLSQGKGDNIEPANVDNGTRLLGITVGKDDSLVAADVSSATVQVATSGTAAVLASTLDGNINAGDYIAVSPINGVGMKALPGSRVIGLAQSALNDKTPNLDTRSIKANNATSMTVKVGYVQVSIAIGTNPLDAGLTSPQRLVRDLTGNIVSTFRIIIGLVIAILALIITGTLIYSSVYGGLISAGRNPMGKQRIIGALIWVFALSAVVILVSGGTIYLLLR